jgi:hypothetical protein
MMNGSTRISLGVLVLLAAVIVKGQYHQGHAATAFLPGLGPYLPAQSPYARSIRDVLKQGSILTGAPLGDPGPKCSYVQMKGSSLPGAECQAGGMACDKECGLVDADDPNAGQRGCITVMEEMCGDVSKEECANVDEKICEPIQEEICDEQDPDDFGSGNASLNNNQTR